MVKNRVVKKKLFKSIFFFLIFIVLPFFLCGQNEDSLKHQLEAVEVFTKFNNPIVTSSTPLQIVHREQIEKSTFFQVSDALKLMSGVVIKDYGGIGGLKTVSVRGFGSQHTTVTYEGIALTNSQTGQIDLSRISVENIDNLSLIYGEQEAMLQPARHFSSANLIQINNLKPIFKKGKRSNFDFRLAGGSYHFINPYFKITQLLKEKKSEHDAEVSSYFRINYLQSRGNYPYKLYYGNNGDSISSERRSNSDIHAFSAETGLFTTFKDSSLLHFVFSYYDSERGLPGATILYNLESHSRIWDKNMFGQMKFVKKLPAHLTYQSLLKFDYGYTRYVDPDYLNAAHFLKNIYIQREYYFSNALQYEYQNCNFSFANDIIYQNMSANLLHFVYPQRLGVLSVVTGRYNHKYFQLGAHLLHSLYAQNSKKDSKPTYSNHFSPAVSMAIRPFLSQQFYLRFFYKNIFRMPTFNDLYYRDVGNLELNPEKTNQFNVGLTYSYYFPLLHLSFSITSDAYFNQIKDKIIAIPNKNLFIWTMLNYGEVNIYGININTYCTWQVTGKLSFNWQGNYTFQKAINVTDKNSKTYQHQLPYTPLHSGAFIFSVEWNNFFVSNEFFVVGKRYTLEQNVIENELLAYIDDNLSFGINLNRLKIPVTFSFEILNIANIHYEVIKNYPMPGRQFRFKVTVSW